MAVSQSWQLVAVPLLLCRYCALLLGNGCSWVAQPQDVKGIENMEKEYEETKHVHDLHE